MDICLERINDMVVQAKKKANIPLDTPLKGLVSDITYGHCNDDV